MVRLDFILDSWKGIRQDGITAVEEFPADEWDFRAAADVMTFGEIARHILQAGDGLSGMLLAGEGSFQGPEFRSKLETQFRPVAPGAAGLAAALRQSIEERTAAAAGKPRDFWDGMVTRFDGMRVTRLEMLQTIKEHELTHRQQLFLYLRIKGIVPVTTRRRLARQAAQ